MPTVKQLRQQDLQRARLAFADDIAQALSDIRTFAADLVPALGVISRDEAIAAVQRKAREVFEALR